MTSLDMLVVASAQGGSSEAAPAAIKIDEEILPLSTTTTTVAATTVATEATTAAAAAVAIKTTKPQQLLPQPSPQQQQQVQQQVQLLAPQPVAIAQAPTIDPATAMTMLQPQPQQQQQQQQLQLPKPSQLPKLFPASRTAAPATSKNCNIPNNAPTIGAGTATATAMNGTTRGSGNGGGGGQLLQFPWKLHEMLHLAEKNRKTDVISWLPGGNGFKVHNKIQFCSEIMPGYFASQKYKTFQRSLNLWGFESVAKGPERGACYHQYFVKGHPELCHSM